MNGRIDLLLKVSRLKVHLPANRGMVRAVDDVSFNLEKGRTLAIVGESGCGKSMLCRTIMGLAPGSALIDNRSKIVFNQKNLIGLTNKQWNRIRGRRMAMIFQDPMSSLNPVLTIGRQIMETLRFHLGFSKKSAQERAVELLQSVGLPHPVLRLKQYPYQLSGGMRQRAAIAIALSCRPQLLIADEPTTALDVTVQAEILNLLRQLQKDSALALLLVTHDLGLAASYADDVAVMYAGQIVEKASAFDIFKHARMPYTKMLMEATPRLTDPAHGRLPAIEGRPPDMIDPPLGCRFAPRCPKVDDRCREAGPDLQNHPDDNHFYACFHPESASPNEISSGAAQ